MSSGDPTPRRDAGRVIAGTARGVRLDAPGRGHAAARRSGQADALRDPRAGAARAPRSWTCSPAVARPASRRSRGARRRPCSSSATAGGARGHRREPAPRPASRGRARRSSAATRSAGSRGAAPTPRPFGIVVVDPPYADTALLAAALARSAMPAAAGSRAGRRRGRQALLARRAAGRGSGCYASDRERRFGETALTFYRWPTRTARRRMNDRGLPRLVRPDHDRPPRRPPAGRSPSSTASSSASSRTRGRRRCSPAASARRRPPGGPRRGRASTRRRGRGRRPSTG